MMSRLPTEAYNHGYDDAERGHPWDGGPYATVKDRADYADGYHAAEQQQSDDAQAYRLDAARDRITEDQIDKFNTGSRAV